ncbi:MAG TPA: ABC transporter ATP-binding protein [Patescibacteria group bacterium]|nr:ABC transporter ATP-binding protein [Patescibacteria group bacterium]
MARKIISRDALEHKFSWMELAKSIWFLLSLGKLRRQYVIGLVMLFIFLTYSVVPPLIIGAIVNFFTRYTPGQSFTRFYLLSASLGGSMIVVSYIRLSIKRKLSLLNNISVYQMKTKGFEILLSRSLIETSKESTGEKVQKIQNGIDSFIIFYKMFSNQIMTAIASSIGIFVVLSYLRLTYGLFFFSYAAMFFVILRAYTSRLNKLNLERYQAIEKASGAYVEGINNIATLKSMGSEKHFQTRIMERENISKQFSDKITRVINRQWKVFQALNGLSAGIFLFFIGRDVISGILSVGEIVIFYSYFENIRNFSSQIMDFYGDIIQAKSGIGRMVEVFKIRQKNSRTGIKNFPDSWNEIKISNGNFLYKSGAGLHGINISIKKGEKIGIVGKTGSGKSTIAKIFLGLYELKSGKFEIDGENFYDIDSEKIFENISVVPQDIEMFNMSLAENITLFRNINDDLFNKAIEISQLQEVISRMASGLDTTIGEKGYKLSGGERQRLAIARAICQNSQILILDEATSALDTKTERSIYQALDENFPNKTIIAVAHRIKTLENTNRIYVFKRGNIVEEGKYEDLLANEESYLFDISKKRLKNIVA